MPAPKKTAKKSVQSKEIALVGKKEVWAGAAGITGARTGDDAKNQELIMKVGQAFGIPPIGVNILGGKPYINKDGLLYKLHEYSNRKKRGEGRVKGIRKEYVQYALKPEDTSVCKATIEYDDDTFVEAIGEANRQSVSLEKVKSTLNQMAETRAINRAIRQAITFELWQEAMERFNTLPLDSEERAAIETAVTVSAEEMDQKGAAKVHEVATATSEESLSQTITDAINKAKTVQMLEQIRAGVETSTNLSDPRKKMLLGMIDGKIRDKKAS